MTDDSSADGVEAEQAEIDRKNIRDLGGHKVAIGDVEVDDEPEELHEEDVDDPEYEPLEPDEPE